MHEITPPEPLYGRIALLIEVPPEDRKEKIDDVADAYAVELSDEAPGGCIIYGLYGKAWVGTLADDAIRHSRAADGG